MRINLIGNILNWAVIFGDFFRRRGHDVRVFIDKDAPDLYLPGWEFPEYENNLPEWIEMVDVDLKKSFIRRKKERDFIGRLGDCDIIQAFGESAIWASMTKTPFVFLSYGGDLEILPFNTVDLKGLIYARLLKNALRKARAVLYCMPRQKRSVAKLKLANNKFFPYGIPLDTARYGPFNEDKKGELKKAYKSDFIFFQPTRQEWTCTDTNNKGNDKLIRAFARFTKDADKKTVLIAVEKGRDLERSKKLVKELGIEEHMRWIDPAKKAALIDMLNTADICFDNFSYGFYGIAALESLSVGVPTFLYLNRLPPDFEAPPVINVFSEHDIYRKITELVNDRAKLSEIGTRSREWVLRHHHWERVIDRYLGLYGELLNKN